MSGLSGGDRTRLEALNEMAGRLAGFGGFPEEQVAAITRALDLIDQQVEQLKRADELVEAMARESAAHIRVDPDTPEYAKATSDAYQAYVSARALSTKESNDG